ncbi:unnamed protein product [Schistosoma margrebowiei]|uniref:Uncharacterized protein n=1 Tax=Schistosoma margrebowiei TaxID=48269 RepID=A0A183MIQ0_9TREM|nr:unnamed protein product [Schistosoma margrebowiei]
MEDLRVRRRADVDLDHHLVVANMKLKLTKHCTTGGIVLQRFNAALLGDTNKLKVPQDDIWSAFYPNNRP